MYYPAKFVKEDNGYTVTFRDIPEAITCGADMPEAMEMAEDVLLSSVEIYFDMDKNFPLADSDFRKMNSGYTYLIVCMPKSYSIMSFSVLKLVKLSYHA